jgi:hypothetical protein
LPPWHSMCHSLSKLQQDSCTAQAASYFASLPMDVGCKTEARLVGSGTPTFRCGK